MSDKVASILEEIKGLTLLEASQLVKEMESAFGVSAPIPPTTPKAVLRCRPRRFAAGIAASGWTAVCVRVKSIIVCLV